MRITEPRELLALIEDVQATIAAARASGDFKAAIRGLTLEAELTAQWRKQNRPELLELEALCN